jgi:hypothetical protein
MRGTAPAGSSEAQTTSGFPAASGRLDLHEGIWNPPAVGCPRWPARFRLLSSHGELVPGRCRATNLCAYCARLNAVETSEMLALDAMEGAAPVVWAVLTTRTPSVDPSRFYLSRRQVQKALRRRWPSLQVAWVIEYTTGYGPRSGGLRRPHWNALLKGIPADDVDQVRDVITSVWCAREDALPGSQFVGQVAEVGGLMRYLALHFLKESQTPPPGWSGHRFTATRGYLWTDTPSARAAARRSLRIKREIHRAQKRGLEGIEAEQAAAEAMAVADATTWAFVDPQSLVTGSRWPCHIPTKEGTPHAAVRAAS